MVIPMHTLDPQDEAKLLALSNKFKIIVPLATLQSECNEGILKELLENLIDLALRYTESVCRWQRLILEQGTAFDEHGTRQAIEETRTNVHTAFNNQVNILSRTMTRHGKSAEWRNQLGDDRASMGRFALVLSFEYVRQTNEGGAS